MTKLLNHTNGVSHHHQHQPQEIFVLPMTSDQAQLLIETDHDFVMSKRYGYSLKRLLEAHPNGCSSRVAAAALMMTEAEVEACYQKIVLRLRDLMGVE